LSVVAGVVQMLVSRNQALLARASDEARADPLTGLLNRRGFEERAAPALAAAQRSGSSVAVACFDLDFFKNVNDTYGHATGDQVLRGFARLLVDTSRRDDAVARLGGEEFVVLLPGCALDDAYRFTTRVHTALPRGLGNALPLVRVSAGVASAVAPATIATLLCNADAALYEAKAAGRNRTVAHGAAPPPIGGPVELPRPA
jgi:diguanylate cyclase (GGDEF)-like protein